MDSSYITSEGNLMNTMNSLKRITVGVLSFFAAQSSADIIFESDFSNDGSYYATHQQASWTEVTANAPTGFIGALIEGNGKIYGVPGAGVDDSVAMKFEWDPALGQPVSQLYLHLTGDKTTGYDEVYVRYHVRLPNNIKIGIPGVDDIPYWKFGRLWQNTGTAPGDRWTENRTDSGYAVWNFGGTETWGVDAGGTFGANNGSNLSKGSAGGERYSNDYYIGRGDFTKIPGHFRAVGEGSWDFDPDTRLLYDKNQQWHTLEWRFKLSSSASSNDGIFQMWFNGIEQVPVDIRPGGGAPSLSDLKPHEIPTTVMGSGYNFLVVFDNMAYWNKEWDNSLEGNGIFVNDVVVSTKRIGHDYRVGGDLAPQKALASPPPGLKASPRLN